MKRDARSLCKDPRLREVALLASGATRSGAEVCVGVAPAALAAVAPEDIAGTLHLYTARVLHGLPSRLLPANAWREDQAGLWGRYRHVAFDDIIRCLHEERHAATAAIIITS